MLASHPAFKLVTDNDRSAPIVWELYDLTDGRSETNNAAEKHPEVISELSTQWERFADRANVKPFPETRSGL